MLMASAARGTTAVVNPFRCLTMGLAVALVLGSWSVRAKCPIMPEPPRSELSYQDRETHCEGLLPTLVEGRTQIQFIGYHASDVPLATANTLRLRVIAPSTLGEQLQIRALGHGVQTRYRMDSPPLGTDPVFTWNRWLKAQNIPLPPANVGLVGCTQSCLTRASTRYHPVELADAGSSTATLHVLLRSEVRAGSVAASLRAVTGEKVIAIATPGKLRLEPGVVSRVTLPAVPRSDYYRLIVNAQTVDTDEPMGRLDVLLYVPSSSR